MCGVWVGGSKSVASISPLRFMALVISSHFWAHDENSSLAPFQSFMTSWMQAYACSLRDVNRRRTSFSSLAYRAPAISSASEENAPIELRRASSE